MRRAIFPGTFDPFTIGHYSVVKRALTFMDEVVIGIGISCYFLFLKKRMTDDVFIAKEEIPSAVFEPISPKEEISSLAETKIKQDSTHEVTATPTDKKDIVAKSKSIPKTQSAPVAITPVIEETVGRTDIQEERIVADTDTSLSEVHQLKAAKAATPNLNLIKGKVTDEKENYHRSQCSIYRYEYWYSNRPQR